MSRSFPFMLFPRAADAEQRVDEKKCASHSEFGNRIPIRKTPALGGVRGLVVVGLGLSQHTFKNELNQLQFTLVQFTQTSQNILQFWVCE